MANEKNLIPLNRRSKEEQRRIQSMGGVASGVARRKNIAFKERLIEALRSKVTNKTAKKIIKDMNINGDENVDAVIASLIAGSIQGNSALIKILLEALGELAAQEEAKDAGSITLVLQKASDAQEEAEDE